MKKISKSGISLFVTLCMATGDLSGTGVRNNCQPF